MSIQVTGNTVVIKTARLCATFEGPDLIELRNPQGRLLAGASVKRTPAITLGFANGETTPLCVSPYSQVTVVKVGARVVHIHVADENGDACTWNLDNALIEDLTMTEGMVALTQELTELDGPPAVGGEGLNEMNMRYQTFAQAHLFDSITTTARISRSSTPCRSASSCLAACAGPWPTRTSPATRPRAPGAWRCTNASAPCRRWSCTSPTACSSPTRRSDVCWTGRLADRPSRTVLRVVQWARGAVCA